MTDGANYGISGTGINISAQNFAVGSRSSIVAGAGGPVEQSNQAVALAVPLEQLRLAIDAFQGPQATKESLSALHREVTAELQTASPNRQVLVGKLESLQRLAGPAATIVQAAAVLAHAIGPLL